jgi:Uma2 family endonuclease
MSTATLSLPAPDGRLELDAGGLQGTWTTEQYLRLAERTNRLVELVDGRLEALPMPSTEHQILLVWLLKALAAGAGPEALVLPAPLPLQLPNGRFREPDLLLPRAARDSRRGSRAWTGADLVVEIVSPDDPERDYRDKHADYAAARVAEYWLVDPGARRFSVLRLAGEVYVEHGVYGPGEVATSPGLPTLAVDVTALFAAIG